MIHYIWFDWEEPPMWTNENRSLYDRSKLRYSRDLTYDEWTLIAPLIPPAKQGGGTADGGHARSRQRFDVCAINGLPVAGHS